MTGEVPAKTNGKTLAFQWHEHHIGKTGATAWHESNIAVDCHGGIEAAGVKDLQAASFKLMVQWRPMFKDWFWLVQLFVTLETQELKDVVDNGVAKTLDDAKVAAERAAIEHVKRFV